MLSTNSSSKTIIRENLKRYWVIAFLGYIGYVMQGMMPVLMNYRTFNAVADYARSVVMGTSFVINLFIVIIAIVAGSAVFGYLHTPVSSNATHALPVNRKQLFGSAVISGWLLCVIPLVIFAFSMLVLRGASSASLTSEEMKSLTEMMFGSNASAQEIYTLPHILSFLLTSVICTSVIFATTCLAAVMAGKKVIHELLALFIFILPSALVLTADSLCSEFLFGFDSLDVDYSWLNVTMAAMTEDTYGMDWQHIAYYIVVTILLLGLSLMIYKKVKLERIGMATTFPVVSDVLVVILTILASLSFGGVLDVFIDGSSSGKATRYVIVTLISSFIYYAIMRMIADGGPAIFSLKNLKKYGVCFVLLLVILAFTAMDISGFAGKTINSQDVESVHLETGFPKNVIMTDASFDDPEVTEALLGVQTAIISEKDVKGKQSAEGYDEFTTEEFTLKWKLKNGKELKRKYMATVDENHVKTNEALKKLFNTKAFRESLRIDVAKENKRTKMIEIYSSSTDWEEEENIRIKKEDWEGLLEAIDKDLSGVSYELLSEYSDPVGDEGEEEECTVIDITYKEDDYSGGNVFYIRDRDKNTIAFLKDKGYIK